MRIPAILTLLCILPASAFAQVKATFGPRGEVTELRVGDTLYFTDVAVALVKPGWAGDVVNQRAADPAAVQVEQQGEATVYTMTLAAGEVKVKLREVARVTADKVALEYEVTPEQDTPVETILQQGALATAAHAGKTRYVAADGGLAQGICPAELNPDTYVIFGGRAADWVGFEAPGGPALRVIPEGLNEQFQDDRKWNTPAFTLLSTCGGGTLRANQTIKFGLTYAADTAEKIEADVRDLTRNDLASLKLGDDRPLKIGKLALDKTTVETFSPIELSADIAASYDNPFDPEQVAVDAEITGPSGKAVTVPGFYYAPMRLETKLKSEYLRLAGTAGFRVRYAPPVPGSYRLVLKVRDRSGAAQSAPVQFTATAGKNPGCIRVAKASPHYFAFDSGKPYFAVGEDVCWSWGSAPVAIYNDWFKGLGGAGGNWARLWLSFNEKGQEWMPAPTPRGGPGTYMGLGKYALDNAWRLDRIVGFAQQYGVYVMLCLGTYGEFTEGGYFNEGSWVSNPYNAKNGGPCAKPEDFWTNEQARKMYKQRLRYLIARWGYSPNLFGWEFWNEVPPSPPEVAWIAEMATYLKQYDPSRHLVSTTYGAGETWKCPDVDFSMSHMYGQAGNTADFTPNIVNDTRQNLRWGKPYLLAEFGIDWQTSDSKWDPKGTGLNMHNGAWAAMMSGAAGTSMLWYWDGYVHPNNLYHILTPARKFADTIDWTKTRFEPVSGIQAALTNAEPETLTDLTIPGTYEWGATPSAEYTALQDGAVRGEPIAMTIGSPKRGNPGELHTKLTWHLDMPKAGQVLVHLGQVSNSAHLQISVDGEVKADRALTTGEPGKGPWKEAHWLAQYKLWQCNYDEDIPVDVPAGKHDLVIANTDGDWLQINRITLPQYRSSRYPGVNLLGLQSDRMMLLWVQNRESTWRTEFDGKQPRTLRGLQIAVPAAVKASERWTVEWWDTFTGEIIRRDTVKTTDGKLQLAAPDFTRDLAVKVVRE